LAGRGWDGGGMDAEVGADWVDVPHIRQLAAADDPQIGPVLLCLQDRRLPLAGQIFEGVRVEESLVELPALEVAQLGQGCVSDTFSTRRLNAVFARLRALAAQAGTQTGDLAAPAPRGR
jgi:hypothetical protein